MIGTYTITQALFFLVLVIVCLIVDLVAHKQDEAISLKSAALWSAFWVALAFSFAGFIWYTHGFEDASLFTAGYLLEKSLSVDNLFVIMAIFGNFSVKDEYQHRVLYYGILGALIFRFIFIALGTGLIAMFGAWALGAFGLFVLWSAWKMWENMRDGNEEIEDYSQHWSVRYTKKVIPVHPQLDGHNFFTRQNGVLAATPLFLCLIAIEVADVMFAFDSVPAIMAITQEPFLVYTSNIFAILGLRSMYFLLAAAKRFLCHLEKAVIAILAFIGIKMLLMVLTPYHLPAMTSLAVVVSFLTLGIVASIMFPEKDEEDEVKEETKLETENTSVNQEENK